MLNVKADKTKTRDTYRAPQLKLYGGMAKLTASGTVNTPEGTGAGNVVKRP